MKTKKNKMTILLATIGMVFISCQHYPKDEVGQAQATFDITRSVGAELYTPESFKQLQDLLDAALILVETQNSKFIKNFDKSRDKLNAVSEMAAKVSLEVQEKKNELKMEIELAFTDTRALLDENNQLVQTAPKGKEGAATLEEIKNDIQSLSGEVENADKIFQDGDFINTLEMINAAKQRLTSINAELKGAISKVTKGKIVG